MIVCALCVQLVTCAMVAPSPLHAVLAMRHLLALVFANFVMGVATLSQAVPRALHVLPGASLSLAQRPY